MVLSLQFSCAMGCSGKKSSAAPAAVSSAAPAGEIESARRWKNKRTDATTTTATSAPDERADDRNRLIVFIAGGVSYNESRCAAEVARAHPNWDVYIGGHEIWRPREALRQIAAIPTQNRPSNTPQKLTLQLEGNDS
eukprot:m.784947 g.784947  ORF g.784947 m.784947 type:complete len:137 (+) comp59160_c1_seq19:1670-2080(+)